MSVMPALASTACHLAAIEYLERGFSVLPLRRDNKKPLVEWKEFQSRLATEDEVDGWFSRWPDANVGIITGAVSGGLWVADADGPQGVDWLRANLPVTGVYVRTSKGWHAYFRAPKGTVVANRGRIAPEVDIRGEGGYVVAPPSVHASGHVYELEIPPGLSGWEDIPEHAPDAALRSVTAAGNLQVDLTGARATPTLAPTIQGGRNNALAALAGRWASLGLDIDEIVLLAKGWNLSCCRPPLGERELLTTVQSIYKTHLRNNPAIEAAGTPVLPQATDAALPDIILQPGGLLQDVMEFIDANSPASLPAFNLAAAITLVGTLAGQRVMTETGLRTNVYCVGLGYSGSGKNAPFSAIPKLLGKIASTAQGPSEITSDSALLRWLTNPAKAVALFMLDEFGLYLQAAGRPMSPAAGVPKVLMELFSKTDGGHVKPYASGDDIVVRWHHVSLYGASTPTHFWRHLGSERVNDGFLARILVFQSKADAPKPRTFVSHEIPDDLVQKLSAIWEIKTETRGGNLEAIPVPHVVGKTEDAVRLMTPWADRYHDLKNQAKDDLSGASAIYSRAAEHVHKLALIHAVSRHGAGVLGQQVGPDSVEWAMAIVEHSTRDLLSEIKFSVAENEWHSLQQKILKIISREATPEKPGATRKRLMQQAHLPSRTLNDVLQSMADAGMICMTTFKAGNGREAQLICLAGESDE